MNKAQMEKTVKEVEILFKEVMRFYWDYLNQLETLIKSIPEDQTDFLKKINDHIAEVEESLEHDMALFDQATQEGIQDVHGIHDRLKIDQIRHQLKQQ